jgi:hypothetical protein
MPKQSSQNPKTQGAEKNFDRSEIGANNPVKKEESERRNNRENADKANQNLGSQKYRESNIETGRNEQSAR